MQQIAVGVANLETTSAKLSNTALPSNDKGSEHSGLSVEEQGKTGKESFHSVLNKYQSEGKESAPQDQTDTSETSTEKVTSANANMSETGQEWQGNAVADSGNVLPASELDVQMITNSEGMELPLVDSSSTSELSPQNGLVTPMPAPAPESAELVDALDAEQVGVVVNPAAQQVDGNRNIAVDGEFAPIDRSDGQLTNTSFQAQTAAGSKVGDNIVQTESGEGEKAQSVMQYHSTATVDPNTGASLRPSTEGDAVIEAPKVRVSNDIFESTKRGSRENPQQSPVSSLLNNGFEDQVHLDEFDGLVAKTTKFNIGDNGLTLNIKQSLVQSAFAELVPQPEVMITAKDSAVTTAGISEGLARVSGQTVNLTPASVGTYSSNIPVPFGDPEWADSFAQKVVWLSGRDIKAAEIHINPPELGPVEVKISVQNDQTSVNFNVQHSSVRELLESNVHRLREMLNANGVELADVNVGEQSSHSERESEGSQTHGGVASGISSGMDDLGDVEVTATSEIERVGLVDYYA